MSDESLSDIQQQQQMEEDLLTLYSWNLMVRVFGWLLVLDFFLFLSLPGASLLWHVDAAAMGLAWGLGVMAAGGGAGGDAIEILERGLRLDVVEPKDIGLGAGASGRRVVDGPFVWLAC